MSRRSSSSGPAMLADSTSWKKLLGTQAAAILVVLVQSLQGVHSIAGLSLSSTSPCANGTAHFRLDLRTDFAPSETKWTVSDAVSNAPVLNGGPYNKTLMLYKEEYCIDEGGCYKFTISDAGGNGICCGNSFGYYELFYQDTNIISSGGEFDFEEISPAFGHSCPSPSPSISSAPSLSNQPSSSPSFHPSLAPTESSIPSTLPSKTFFPTLKPSVKPSMSPTSTASPTIQPTESSGIEFDTDPMSRRRFPPLAKRGIDDEKYSYPMLPNCTSTDQDRIGCITFPKRTPPPPPPDWAGKLHFYPPTCKTNEYGRNRQCSIHNPVSINALPTILTPVSSGFEKERIREIPEGARLTMYMSLGDFNKDGIVDVAIANVNNTPNQVLLNKGDGSFDNIDLPFDILHLSVCVAVADLDGDSWDDIIFINIDQNQALYVNSILWNNRDLTFDRTEFPSPGEQQHFESVVIADLNNDGELDFILANPFGLNQYYLNKGNRSFQKYDIPGSSHSSYSIVAGDFTNNGKVDLVFGNEAYHNQLFLNQGTASDGSMAFDAVDIVHDNSNARTHHMAVGDIDGDGFLEIVTSDGLAERLPSHIYWGLGNGQFDVRVLPESESVERSKVAIADFDNNGILDIILPRRSVSHKLLFFKGDRTFDVREFIPKNQTNSEFYDVYPLVADFDLNGLNDIMFGMLFQNNELLLNTQPEKLLTVNYLDSGAEVIAAGNLLESDSLVYPMSFVIGGSTKSPSRLINPYGRTIDLPGDLHTSSSIALTYLDSDDSLLDIVLGNEDGPNYCYYSMGDGVFEDVAIPNSASLNTKVIVSGDMNGDGLMDLIVGNSQAKNQMLLNNGNRTFESIDLPGDPFSQTTDIALADLNGDKLLDIIVCNGLNNAESNWVLTNNGNNTFDQEVLPESNKITLTVAVGDILGNDGSLEMVFGNRDEANEIYSSTGTFGYDIIRLSGDVYETTSLAIFDMNGDNKLDIVVMNYHPFVAQPTQLYFSIGGDAFQLDLIPRDVPFRSLVLADFDNNGLIDVIAGGAFYIQISYIVRCKEKGAQFHSQSWCFECPKFMGRTNLFKLAELPECVECLPDHLKSDFGEQCNSQPCPNKERKLGHDTCTECEVGTYYNTTVDRNIRVPETLDLPRCYPCPKGHYTDGSILAIDECIECSSGFYQNNTGASSCEKCKPGTFQMIRGQEECNLCSKGGYCSALETCGGGFEPCPPGRFNEVEGQSNETACIKCPAGTYSTETGAESSAVCLPCPAGTFTNRVGQTVCSPCELGHYQEKDGQRSCEACKDGTYAGLRGLVECTSCPHRLSSVSGSVTCNICDEDFYLEDSLADTTNIFLQPDKYCKPCPPNAKCPKNTTLQSLVIPEQFWRDSLDTSTLYECEHSVCRGSNQSNRRQLKTGRYCAKGFTGPLCQVCSMDGQYFHEQDGKCQNCPSFVRLLIPISVILVIIIIFEFLRSYSRRNAGFRSRISRFLSFMLMLSIQAKLKIFLSFYQIFSTLENVYGAKFDTEIKRYLDISQIFNIDFLAIAGIPEECVGSMKERLIASATWPILFTVLYLFGFLLKELVRGQKPFSKEFLIILRDRVLYFSIVVYYIVLPSVSNVIFNAIKCQSFDTNDKDDLSTSYLMADWEIECKSDDKEYRALKGLFWFYFALWPIGTPLGFFYLLWKVKASVRSDRITPLAQACQFLWQDYRKEMLFWDIFDSLRKLILTGFIMFIDQEKGSTKIARLIMAIIVSTIYFLVLLLTRPYKRDDDLYFASLINTILICCFGIGVMLQLCADGSENICKRHVGDFFNSFVATLFMLLMTIAVIILTTIMMFTLGSNVTKAPIIRLRSSGHQPNLELPDEYKFHLFMSHVWSSGQMKTHNITQLMKMYVPGIKIWLDVDELDDVGSLEKSVSESVVFILYYSQGYFRSRNCRREVNTAFTLKKPVIVLYSGSEEVIEEMRAECAIHCNEDGYSSEEILNYLGKPLRWMSASNQDFTLESVKLVSLLMLKHLPYYKDYPSLLHRGVRIGKGYGQLVVPSEIKILVCANNVGAYDIAKEIQDFLDEESARNITIKNIKALDEEFDGDFLFLYLNEDTFLDSEVSNVIEYILEQKIGIILVHEQDPKKKAVSFQRIMELTPDDFIDQLYRNIAVALYKIQEYRSVSLRQILAQMGVQSEKKK